MLARLRRAKAGLLALLLTLVPAVAVFAILAVLLLDLIVNPIWLTRRAAKCAAGPAITVAVVAATGILLRFFLCGGRQKVAGRVLGS
mmetsp:Transcript_6787/g.14857  ORF Transcript_6787/g.14857 Transcript_6787/m.14857 type:complete len:87 (-) Transcript_6787:673-933(-)